MHQFQLILIKRIILVLPALYEIIQFCGRDEEVKFLLLISVLKSCEVMKAAASYSDSSISYNKLPLWA